ncbi:MAG: carboxypeptidase-like regulatory domain-containing protein, partial [Terracidiphilus sp.]
MRSRHENHRFLFQANMNRRFALQLRRTFLVLTSLLFLAGTAWAGVTGSISGTVKDPSGRVVPNAEITVRELSTGISHETRSNSSGYYSLPVLPVGRYELDVHAPGFETCERKEIVLDTDAALTQDCGLVVGEIVQTVSVTDDELHVETVSTQSGEVISGRQMSAVPLNGRSFTDLLSLQPGVAPSTTIG